MLGVKCVSVLLSLGVVLIFSTLIHPTTPFPIKGTDVNGSDTSITKVTDGPFSFIANVKTEALDWLGNEDEATRQAIIILLIILICLTIILLICCIVMPGICCCCCLIAFFKFEKNEEEREKLYRDICREELDRIKRSKEGTSPKGSSSKSGRQNSVKRVVKEAMSDLSLSRKKASKDGKEKPKKGPSGEKA